ncbi:MAG TPA: hypothetical protein VIF09_13085, partial [Polyangiaceae bacterium]
MHLRALLALCATLPGAGCSASGSPGAAPDGGGAGTDATGGGTADTGGGGTPEGGGTAEGGALVDGASITDGGAGGETSVVADSGPCAIRTGHRGLTSRTLTVGGLKRTYLIYLPQALDPAKAAPFVFVHHGLTMSGQAMYQITQYTD